MFFGLFPLFCRLRCFDPQDTQFNVVNETSSQVSHVPVGCVSRVDVGQSSAICGRTVGMPTGKHRKILNFDDILITLIRHTLFLHNFELQDPGLSVAP